MKARGYRNSDTGQAFPIYITAVAALLFLALAFFAVGQAGATRNGGQTAADAAALAAAQDYRDQLGTALLKAVTDGSALEDLLNGRGIDVGDACAQAQWFAQENDADLTGDECVPDFLPTSFTVTVKTQKPVGKTVIPGTESKYATARAKAVIGPRCTLQPPDEPSPTPTPTPTPTGDEDGDDGGEDEKPSVALTCDGRTVTIDPAHPELLPDVKDLFSVHLAD
ncbi:pilus assembly protein TadG-related protein [Streptomyces himastatinicus]|uniref:pilus assembly protein TadG-related protein n=1 Tax=Streptomyces himastatinicus TaxID=998084 RepID=UPI0001B4CF0D|nr:pilus assembly protein TadG-related protein [Streptomyces himastatinicus]